MNRNVVITGGTKGIGKAIAFRFAQEGFNIAVCSRNSADLDAMKNEFLATFPGINFLSYTCDVRNKKQLAEFAKHVKDNWKQLHVLVNNAGVFIPGQILEEEEGSLEMMMETNVYSAYRLTRDLKDLFLSTAASHIFNLCSIASFMAYPNGGSYSISKFALLGFSKVLREELKTKKVKVTSVMPGATWSHSWKGVDLPTERLMDAKDIADSIWGAYNLGSSAVVEDIVIRPQLGDL